MSARDSSNLFYRYLQRVIDEDQARHRAKGDIWSFRPRTPLHHFFSDACIAVSFVSTGEEARSFFEGVHAWRAERWGPKDVEATRRSLEGIIDEGWGFVPEATRPAWFEMWKRVVGLYPDAVSQNQGQEDESESKR